MIGVLLNQVAQIDTHRLKVLGDYVLTGAEDRSTGFRPVPQAVLELTQLCARWDEVVVDDSGPRKHGPIGDHCHLSVVDLMARRDDASDVPVSPLTKFVVLGLTVLASVEKELGESAEGPDGQRLEAHLHDFLEDRDPGGSDGSGGEQSYCDDGCGKNDYPDCARRREQDYMLTTTLPVQAIRGRNSTRAAALGPRSHVAPLHLTSGAGAR